MNDEKGGGIGAYRESVEIDDSGGICLVDGKAFRDLGMGAMMGEGAVVEVLGYVDW